MQKYSLRPYKRPLGRFKSGKLKLPAKTKYKWFTTPHTLYYEEKLGEYQPIKLTRFNPGSRQHIQTWLSSMYGWEPTEFTPTGGAKVDADTLDALNYPEANQLKDYLKTVKDLGQLTDGDNSLLNVVHKDSRFHGYVDTLGANTGRMTHTRPNITQLPKAQAFRELLCAAPGKVFIDVDADQLTLADLKQIELLGHLYSQFIAYLYVMNKNWIRQSAGKLSLSITIL